MTEPLHIAADVRVSRTVLATVQNGRVMDTRRVEHGEERTAALLAEGVAVLRERAPGRVVGLAAIWRHTERLGVADPSAFVALLAEVGERSALPTSWLPHGAALTLGEALRARPQGRLAVLTVDAGVAGGVLISGQLVDPLRLDPGHWSVDPGGPKCPCGARGCLQTFAGESAIEDLSRDLEPPFETPSTNDWQSLKNARLAVIRRDLIGSAELLRVHAGRAIGLAAGQLADAFGVVEVRVRTRHPDLWHLLAPPAEAALRQVAGVHAPKLSAADPSEDGFFTGAVAAGR